MSLPLSLRRRMIWIGVSIHHSLPAFIARMLIYLFSSHNLDMQLPFFLFFVLLNFCPPSASQCPSEEQSQFSGRSPQRLSPYHLCSRRNQLLWDALCLRGHWGSKILRGHHRWALIQDYTDYGLNRLFSGHMKYLQTLWLDFKFPKALVPTDYARNSSVLIKSIWWLFGFWPFKQTKGGFDSVQFDSFGLETPTEFFFLISNCCPWPAGASQTCEMILCSKFAPDGYFILWFQGLLTFWPQPASWMTSRLWANTPWRLLQ